MATAPAFCPACGSALAGEPSFCASCGHRLGAAPGPAASPGPAPAAPGQYSPDGRWWWNGVHWQAVAAAPGAPAAAPARRPRRTLLRLTISTLLFVGLTVASYLLWPQVLIRSFFVNFFGAFAVLLTAWLVLRVAIRGLRGGGSRAWAATALGVLLLEAVLSAGLNAHADAKTAATLPVLLSYQAEVAGAVALGNQVHAGAAPAGVTYATVRARADGIQNDLANLDVPATLAAYAAALDDWANTISNTARYPVFWNQDLPYQPDPFSLPMTAGQADAAAAAAMGRIATLTTYEQYARATGNLEGERFIGARLAAEAYWLQAVYTSAEPRWPSAQLRFFEPLDNYPVLQAAAAPAGLPPAARPWPAPRHWADCRRNQHGFVACNIPAVLTPMAVVWKAAINPPATYATPTAAVAGAQAALALLDGSGGQPLTGAGSGQDATNAVPPAAFVRRCTAQGGHLGLPVYDRRVSRVPSSEGGWTCRTRNDRCFDLLTYSGNEYRGDGATLDNGSAGCVESGLKPALPLLRALARPAAGGGATPAPAPASSWDGTYTVAAATVHCSGTATGPDGKQVNTSTDYPVAGTFTVRGNVIQGPTPTPISAGGQVTLVVPVTAGSGSATEALTFVHTAGGVSFTGTINAQVTITSGGVVARVTCSGPISGTRN